MIRKACIGVFILFLACGSPQPSFIELRGESMGTWYHVAYIHPKGTDLQAPIDSLLRAVNASLSTYIETSIISKLNASKIKRNEVDRYFVRVFRRAKRVYKKTDGAFDPTVMPLVNAYGFGPKKRISIDSVLLDSLMELVDFDAFELKPNPRKVLRSVSDKSILIMDVIKHKAAASLDFSAIAKGYGVDVVCNYLKGLGLVNYMVEIGGEVRAHGVNQNGQRWRIGIDKPKEGLPDQAEQFQTIIGLSGRALATSGNYRNFREINGRKVVHTIHPKTGKPVISNLLSTSVSAYTCMTADAFATAFMVMGLEKSLEFAEQDPILEAYFIYIDEEGNTKTAQTPGWEEALGIKSPKDQ